jgi:transglutaminase-like putative cysteine protease
MALHSRTKIKDPSDRGAPGDQGNMALEQQVDRNSGRTAHRLAHAVIVYVVAVLLSLPLFIIVDAFVPELVLPIGGGVRVDQLLVFVAVVGAFIVLVKRFQFVMYAVLIIGLIIVSFTTITGLYPVSRAYHGYARFLSDLRETASGVPLAADRLRPFHDADKLRELVDASDPTVRKAAVRMATIHFGDVRTQGQEHTLVQAFSVFKEINSSWRYVSDVKGGEYFATPKESLELMAGDCDDHALLMAACIKAIGGEVRLVRTTGHVYPEMRIGNDAAMERAALLIRKQLFPKEVGEAPLYHHTDADGQHWINLDYTRKYPGGELMNEAIVGVLEL